MQILTAPETESPKKAWFIQNGRSDLAVVKGLFNSLILILYTDLWGFMTDWKEDQGRGQVLGREEGSWEKILGGGKGLFGLQFSFCSCIEAGTQVRIRGRNSRGVLTAGWFFVACDVCFLM